MNVARMVGWGLFGPLFGLAFQAAQAPRPWYVALVLMGYFYPAGIAWLSLRARAPIRVVMIGLGVEAVTLALFSEVVCLDPVVVLVTTAVVVFNAGSTRGSAGSAAILCVSAATLFLASGRLRAVPAVALPPWLHLTMGFFLMGYIILATHQAYQLVLRHAENKRRLVEQKTRIEALHQHLVDTIANPFVADEVVLELIGDELTSDQSSKYRKRIRTRQMWESVGRQTRSFAHDARNLLVPMVTLSEVLVEYVRDEPDALECLNDLDAAARRLYGLVDHLNGRAQTREEGEDACVIQHVVSEVVSLMKPVAPEDVTIHLDNQLDEDLVYVPIDASNLHRCVVNLCVNSLAALRERGQITLTLRPARAEERQRIGVAVDRSSVILSVRDDGAGMGAEVMARIFEPYFTTRADEGGTGLGLATTYALLTDAGGDITVESEEGVGTRFVLIMPTLRAS